MKVVLCGSMRAIDEMRDVADRLAGLGVEAVVPPPDVAPDAGSGRSGVDPPGGETSGDGRSGSVVARKRAFVDEHLAQIAGADAVLVVNPDRRSARGYVGPSALVELAFGRAFDLPLFLLHPMGEGDQACRLEVEALGVTVLHGDVARLPRMARRSEPACDRGDRGDRGDGGDRSDGGDGSGDGSGR